MHTRCAGVTQHNIIRGQQPDMDLWLGKRNHAIVDQTALPEITSDTQASGIGRWRPSWYLLWRPLRRLLRLLRLLRLPVKSSVSGEP